MLDSRYTVAIAKTLISCQNLLYHNYNKTNNLAATKFLLSSLNPALMGKIKEKTEYNNLFHVVWLQLIRSIQCCLAPAHKDNPMTWIEHFKDLKAAIKGCHPSQYTNKNLKALAAINQ